MNSIIADAGFPGGGVNATDAGVFLCVASGLLLSAAAVVFGLVWVFRRKQTKSPTAQVGERQTRVNNISSALVASGALCLVVSVYSGTKLDGEYVRFAAAKESARLSHAADNNRAERSYRSSLEGAPLSILSPILIWLSVGVGILLILVGAWTGLRRQSPMPAQPNEIPLDSRPPE
jgi:hypothetical protein